VLTDGVKVGYEEGENEGDIVRKGAAVGVEVCLDLDGFLVVCEGL
jgi:hypothetical protein